MGFKYNNGVYPSQEWSWSVRVSTDAPIDIKSVVELKSDLYDTDLWSNYNEDDWFLYEGITVYVEETQELYMCIDGSFPGIDELTGDNLPIRESAWRKVSPIDEAEWIDEIDPSTGISELEEPEEPGEPEE